jgi:hypothetical protein
VLRHRPTWAALGTASAAALVLLLLALPADAAELYGTDRCVSDKLRAVGKVCKQVLGAYAKWEEHQNQSRLDGDLGQAGVKLAKAWGRAEKRVRKEVDCAETTQSSAELAVIVEDAAEALAAGVNDGLNLGVRHDARCGAALLKSAQSACEDLLRAEGLHLRQRTADRRRLRLQGDRAEVLADFQESAGAARNGCPTNATTLVLQDLLEDLTGQAVLASTISPAVDDQDWVPIVPTEVSYLGRKLQPICSFGTPFTFYARRGTVNKLVMYYQGGGACWDYGTCALPTFDTVGGDPRGGSTGFADYGDPRNPFKDWNAVFVSYCTGDVHWGDARYPHEQNTDVLEVEHKGAVNARVAEKWARDHFVNPDEIFVTGSSAGAYGAIAQSPYLMEFAWPSSQFAVLGDAGNGVITNEFLVNDISKWGIEKNVPRWIEALDTPITDLSIVDVYIEVARQYPWNRFGTYTSSYDGGSGGQSGFYNVMKSGTPIGGLVWWNATCEWNEIMRAQNFETASQASNFRYYIGSGSAHTIYGRDKIYDDTTGGVPTAVSWIEAMLAGSPDWVNVECADCGTRVEGDPAVPFPPPPDPPPAPFDIDGNIVCPVPGPQ